MLCFDLRRQEFLRSNSLRKRSVLWQNIMSALEYTASWFLFLTKQGLFTQLYLLPEPIDNSDFQDITNMQYYYYYWHF